MHLLFAITYHHQYFTLAHGLTNVSPQSELRRDIDDNERLVGGDFDYKLFFRASLFRLDISVTRYIIHIRLNLVNQNLFLLGTYS
jgi:hypothetical protein